MNEYNTGQPPEANGPAPVNPPPVGYGYTQPGVFASNMPYTPYPQPSQSPYPPYSGFIPPPLLPEMIEKRQVRKLAVKIGMTLIVLMGLMFLWAIAFYFFGGVFGLSAEDLSALLSNPVVLQVVQIVLSGFCFTIPFVIMAKMGRQRVSDIIPLGKPEKGLALPFFLFGIAFCAFANLAVSQASGIFEGFGIHYEVDFGENPTGIYGFLLSTIATAIVPGLVEEFALRGVVMGSLRKYGDTFALLMSSLLFGLMHGNFQQAPFAFLVGLAVGYCVLKTNSLWVACAIHAFNNFISVFFEYVMDPLPVAVQNFSYAILLTAILLGGILALIRLKDRKDVFGLPVPELVSNTNQRVKWFLSSPVIVIFIVICLLQAVLYFF